MIAFRVSMIFFQSSLREQLSITSFIQMSVSVETWKSIKIMKLKIDAFSTQTL